MLRKNLFSTIPSKSLRLKSPKVWRILNLSLLLILLYFSLSFCQIISMLQIKNFWLFALVKTFPILSSIIFDLLLINLCLGPFGIQGHSNFFPLRYSQTPRAIFRVKCSIKKDIISWTSGLWALTSASSSNASSSTFAEIDARREGLFWQPKYS